VNIIESFGPAGYIELDRDLYPAEDTLLVTVKDGDLLGPSIDVNVASITEPAGETVTMLNTTLEGQYEGTIDISATDSAGVLWVSNGDTITATYNDADDGTGNPAIATDTALVDDDPPQPPTALTVQWVDYTPTTVWQDDFEDGDASDWTGSGTGIGGVNTDTANSGIYSMYSGNDIYTWDSPVMDLSGFVSGDLNVWVQQGGAFGGSENPDAGEDLQISYLNDVASWIMLGILSGADAAGTIYTPAYPLGADAFHAGFQVRFYQTGGSGAGFDFWHWDDPVVDAMAPVIGSGPDNKLDWALSMDDGAGDNDVVQYNLYRANNELGPWDTGAIIDTLPPGTITYLDVGRGEFDGINWWYVIRALDGVGNLDMNTNAVPEVPPFNVAPTAPSDPTPSNGAIGVSVDPILSVRAADPNGDPLTMRFYDASGPTLIGTNFNVPSGTYTNMSWPGLLAETTYTWFVEADDGEFVTQSPTWSFTTMDITPPAPPTGLTVDWWGTVTQTWINESFSSGVFPPAGWAEIDPTGNWNEVATANAGGAAPEARFNWVSSVDIWTLYAGPFDTSGLTSMDLEWDNYNNDYGVGVTCKVQTSTNAVSWTDTGWEWISGSGDLGPGMQTYTISTGDVGSSTFYIGFTVDGDAFQLDYWYIDNVLLTSTGGGTTDDNWLNWTLSGDDGAGANDVDHYDIYRSAVSSGPWDAAHIIDTVPAGTATYMDYGCGEFDGINWWYVVRAVDIWGNEEMNTNAVPEIPVADMPPTVTLDSPNGGQTYPAASLISIFWTAADDNPWGPPPNCWIYYDDDTNPGNGQTLITNTVDAGAGTYIWDSAGVPAGDYYLHIVVEDSIGQTNEDWSDGSFTILPPVYNIDLTGIGAGEWVFVSFPILATGDVLTVFDDVNWGDSQSSWDIAQWYDNVNKQWRSFSIYKPASINDMDVFDNTMGVWLHLTSNGGDQQLTVGTGDMPAGPVMINLYTGWNLVSYPSNTPRLASATLPPEADLLSVYDIAQPYLIRDELPNAVTMQVGNAYWVHCTGDTVWMVDV
jgi:hypothetical protein